jgi:ribonuclease III
LVVEIFLAKPKLGRKFFRPEAKEAQLAAAGSLLHMLTNSTNSSTYSSARFETTTESTNSSYLSSLEFDLKMSNFVGLLQSFCKRENYDGPHYSEILVEGPAHQKSFAVQCIVNDQKTVGKGSSKKLAKQQAAEFMWEALKAHRDQ